MAGIDSLQTHLVEELRDLLDAEEQLTKALPRMAKAATAAPLKTAFQRHLEETREQIVRLKKAMQLLGERPTRKTCIGMKGLITEGDKVMLQAPEGALRDAVLITSAQKVEHYEMASYGTARTYAQVLGEPQVARLLERTLKEEKAADGKLTVIAEKSVNEDAAEEWQSMSESLLEQGAELVGRGVAAASRAMKSASRTRRSRSGSKRRRAA